MNDKKVMHEEKEWSPAELQEAIHAMFNEEERIDSLELQSIKNTKSAPINELIGCLTSQPFMRDRQLQSLTLSGWEKIDEDFD